MGAPALMEPTLKYHPYAFRVLTWMSDPHRGQCLVGSLTGAVASQKSNGGARRFPQADWKPAVECKGIREPDCERDISIRDESRS